MQRGDQGAKGLFWLVAVGFLFAAGLSLLNGDPLGAVAAALFGASFVLAALELETLPRPLLRLLVLVVAVVALVLYLYRWLVA